MFSIQFGTGATAFGIGCISVGDGTHTQGAWQIEIGRRLNPESLGDDVSVIDQNIASLRKLNSLYRSFSDQSFAPKDFASRVEPILEFLIGKLIERKNHLVLGTQDEEKPIESLFVEIEKLRMK